MLPVENCNSQLGAGALPPMTGLSLAASGHRDWFNVRRQATIDGKRACPPEDCGGPWSYPDFLDALQNPRHERHEERLDWIGDGFDPEAFDLEAANKQLHDVG